MEKEVRTSLWVQDDAIRVCTFLEDYDGDVGGWKKYFYEIWRYQMTYHFAYEIKVHEVNGGDVCISMLIKKGFKKDVLDMLERFGYREPRISEELVGIIPTYDLPEELISLYTVVAE